MAEWPSNSRSRVVRPRQENSMVLPAGARREYVPSGPVNVPLVVPFTRTVTPESGAPEGSVTFPRSGFWAHTGNRVENKSARQESSRGK